MVVKEYDYIKGSTALNPQRKAPERDERKLEKLRKEKQKKARRLLEEKKKRRKFIRQISLLIVVMGVITITRDTNVYEEQRKLSDIKKEISLMQAENEALKVDLLKFASLDNIKTTAEEQLGMQLPTKDNIVAIDLSQNYFQELDDRDAEIEGKSEKGFFSKMLDALNI